MNFILLFKIYITWFGQFCCRVQFIVFVWFHLNFILNKGFFTWIVEFPDFGSSEFDNVSQLEYPTFCFLFPASMLEEVLIMEQGTGDSLSGIGGVGLDRGRWTRGHVTRTWDIIIDMWPGFGKLYLTCDKDLGNYNRHVTMIWEIIIDMWQGFGKL